MVRSQPGQTVHEALFQIYPTQKRAGRVAQVVERLLSKCEALTLNPSTAKKKKTKKAKHKIQQFYFKVYSEDS
jgi:primosomal protein N''